jgi:hypothetical protein
VGSSLRYLGGPAGFGFGAVWMTAGIGSAIACLLLAALGYGVVFVAERAQANAKTRPSNQTPEAQAAPPLTADELELDHGHYYEPPDDATSPLAAEVEYGWPSSYVTSSQGEPGQRV